MRKTLFLVIAILLISIPAYAAQTARPSTRTRQTAVATKTSAVAPAAQIAPTFVLPSNAVILSEINLSQSDLLGMVKQAIPAFAKGVGDSQGEIGTVVKMLDLNELVASVQGVTALRLIQFKFSGNADINSVLRDFETQVPASKGWSRVFYNTTIVDNGIVVVYTQQGKSFLGAAFMPSGSDNYIVGTNGFLDIPRLAAWAGKTLKFVSMMRDGGRVENIPHPATPQAPPPPGNPPVIN